MMNILHIRQCGNAIELSADGKTGFPDGLRSGLEEELSYNYKQRLMGAKAYDPYSGGRRPITVQKRRLYAYDKYGRMICGAGLLHRVRSFAEKAGWSAAVTILPIADNADNLVQDWDNVMNNFTFRARQDECLVQIASNDRGIVDAPTAFGKSFLYAAIGLLFPKARIYIVTKRLDLVDDITRHLLRYLPNIGQISSRKKAHGRVMVVSADSLHRVDAAACDILIAEEGHELAAPTYSAELAKFNTARMYCFTATPSGRFDGADKKLESLFGPVIFQMTYQEAVALDLVVPIRVRWCKTDSEHNPAATLSNTPRMRWGIWRNSERNQKIASVARSFGPDEQVLIMVTTFEHAAYLKQLLPEFTLCYAARRDNDALARFIKNKLLPPDEPRMSVGRRLELKRQFEDRVLKKAIATDIWSTGVSFNSLSVLIRADARSSSIMDTQIPGRVCRLHHDSGKQEGLVIDFSDQFDPGFRTAARKRRRNYTTKGWVQEFESDNNHFEQ